MEQIRTIFIPLFMDMIHRIQEEWDLLIICIRNGTIPDIEHIDHIRNYLQVNFWLANVETRFLTIVDSPACRPTAGGGTSEHRASLFLFFMGSAHLAKTESSDMYLQWKVFHWPV